MNGCVFLSLLSLTGIFLESHLAQPGLWHAARPAGHLSVVLCGENLGRTGGTVSASHRMEGQSGWPEIHGAAGQAPHDKCSVDARTCFGTVTVSASLSYSIFP